MFTNVLLVCFKYYMLEYMKNFFHKGRSSKFRVGSRVRQTPEEGRRTYRPKRYGNNNKDEDNSPKNFNDHQASSQKFRQLSGFI